jgi:SAM-dependent methyltransferase
LTQLAPDLATMRLYQEPELVRWVRAQVRAKFGAEGELNEAALFPVDQHHYDPPRSLSLVFETMKDGMQPTGRILNIGGGMGGPVRYLASTHSVPAVSVEVQGALHRLGEELTRRTRLEKVVTHVEGDFLARGALLASLGPFSAILSWLTLLHFRAQDRRRVFQESLELLRPGGYFWAEDWARPSGAPLDEVTRSIVEDQVHGFDIWSVQEYEDELRGAGFELVKVDDVKDEWRDWTAWRLAQWDAKPEAINGDETWRSLRQFYALVADLYKDRKMGGVRLLAKKKE